MATRIKILIAELLEGVIVLDCFSSIPHFPKKFPCHLLSFNSGRLASKNLESVLSGLN